MESKPTDQRKALEEAWLEIHGKPVRPDFAGARFTAMLDAGAWLSAAEMLLDPSWRYEVSKRPNGTGAASVWTEDCPDEYFEAGETPALALLSAILAARGQNDE